MNTAGLSKWRGRWTVRPAVVALAVAMITLFAGEARPDSANAVSGNDNLAAAHDVGSMLPYTDFEDNSGGTTEVGETTSHAGCTGTVPAPITGATNWYKTRGTGITMLADTIGSPLDTVLAVYSTNVPSPGYGDLTFVGCSGDEFGSSNSGVSFFAAGGNDYYFQLGGNGGAIGAMIFNLGIGPGSLGATFNVKSSADANDVAPGNGACIATNGQCTLRAAIQESNALFGPQFIRLGISGPPIISITLGALPAITDSVNIDGRTQSGYAGTPIVVLDGLAAGPANGLSIATSYVTVRGLVINNFQENGIATTAGNSDIGIQGNYIGVRENGVGTGTNGFSGVKLEAVASLVGGTTEAARNVISLNGTVCACFDYAGVVVDGSNNRVMGNYIGTDATGTLDRGNTGNGITTLSGYSLIERNVISGNTRHGLDLRGGANHYLATNYVGTDVAGMAAIANDLAGVLITSSFAYVYNNTISGNGSTGVSICDAASCFGQLPGSTNNNSLYYNRIGVDALGGPLGNGFHGVAITNSDNNNVGIYYAPGSNIIANNGGTGVLVEGTAQGNQIAALIHSNSSLGIDLGNDGVTANDAGDADLGPNRLQNYPVISSAVGGVSTAVLGSIETTPNAFLQVDVYVSPTCDPSGHGEGATHIGYANVTTDLGGSGGFTLFGPPTTLGHVVTATATDLATYETSEFSQCKTLAGDIDGDLIDDNSDNCPTTTNPLQENFDADKFGNVCDTEGPSPNTNGLGGADDCVDAVDNEGDTLIDAAETACDTDGDGVVNLIDNCDNIVNPGQENGDGDALGDACDNCPLVATPWIVPPLDSDCDSFRNSEETYMGTMVADRCALTSGTNNEPPPDGWPVDFNDNQFINTVDVGAMVSVLGSSSGGGPPYDPRKDLNANGSINTIDVGRFVPLLGQPCVPD